MLFGVDGDANVGDICGLAGTASKKLRRINGLIRGLVAPDPHVRVTPSTVDGHFVIRVDVPSGGGTIHGLLLQKDKPEYFIRRNGSTYPAQPDDLGALTAMRATGQSVHLPGRIGASDRAGWTRHRSREGPANGVAPGHKPAAATLSRWRHGFEPRWGCHWGVRTKSRTPLAQKGGPKVAPRVVPRCSGEATSTPDRGTAAPAAELCPRWSGTGLLSLTSPFPGCACQLTLGAARSWRIPPGRSRCAAPRQDPSQRWR